jgi:putative transposase
VIDRLKADLPVSYLCEKLGVSRSGYYDWARREPSPLAQRRDELAAKVLCEFAASERSAGYRKVTAALHADGVAVDRKTVAARMRELGLIPLFAEAAFKKANQRSSREVDPVDLVNRLFSSLTPGAVLVGDITYVHTREGWLYVSTVIDLASRAVLGYATGKRQTVGLIVRAMDRARAGGHVAAGAIFHSDHGSQYRAKSFAKYCGKHGIRRSMGANMQCWDNAVAESFFSKLKNERLTWLTFTTRRAATHEVVKYIGHYNTRRRHQSLGYKTPTQALTEFTSTLHTTTTTPAAA